MITNTFNYHRIFTDDNDIIKFIVYSFEFTDGTNTSTMGGYIPVETTQVFTGATKDDIKAVVLSAQPNAIETGERMFTQTLQQKVDLESQYTLAYTDENH